MTQAGDPIQVKASVQQVTDGWKYKGDMIFNEIMFAYDLEFNVRVDKIGDELADKQDDLAAFERTFKLTIKKTADSQESIETPGEIRELFISTLIKMAMDFYNDPQPHDSLEGILGKAILGQGQSVDVFGVSSVIQAMSKFKVKRFPALVEFLEEHAA